MRSAAFLLGLVLLAACDGRGSAEQVQAPGEGRVPLAARAVSRPQKAAAEPPVQTNTTNDVLALSCNYERTGNAVFIIDLAGNKGCMVVDVRPCSDLPFVIRAKSSSSLVLFSRDDISVGVMQETTYDIDRISGVIRKDFRSISRNYPSDNSGSTELGICEKIEIPTKPKF